MAGYTRKVRTFVLEFADEEYEGLEIEMKSLPLGEFLSFSKMFESDAKSDEQIEALLRVFAGKIVRWNFEEEDGSPVPANYEGVLTLDLDFAMAVIAGWVQGMQNVTPSVGKASDSGGTFPTSGSPMMDIPMEVTG